MKILFLYLRKFLDFPTKAELLQITQKYFRILGIHLVQTTQKYPLNLRNLRTFLVFGSGTIFSLVYTFYLAKTFEEYIATFYVLSSMLICFISFSFIIWRMKRLIRSFSNVSQTIQERTMRAPNYYHYASKILVTFPSEIKNQFWALG